MNSKKFFEEMHGFNKRKPMQTFSRCILFALLGLVCMVGSSSLHSVFIADTAAADIIQSDESSDTESDNNSNDSFISDDVNSIEQNEYSSSLIEISEEDTKTYSPLITDEQNNDSESSVVTEEETTQELPTYWNRYTDLARDSGVTAEMLDAATDYYQSLQNFENKFVGKGWVFIEAGKQSGLDPLWLYSLARWESGFGTSHIAVTKHNYYGIGAWDTDPLNASTMGDDFYNGIVNGAIWIRQNYYDIGQTTMESMNSVPYHSYAPGNTVWIPTIEDAMNSFYRNWRK